METGLPDGSFDFAIARFVFQHLPNPMGATKEIWRLLKPGGKLIIFDSDDSLFGIIHPPVPGLPALMEKYAQAQAQRGGDRHKG